MEEKKGNLHEVLKKNGEYNSCTRMLLPSIMLPIPQFSLEGMKILGFINCYLIDKTEGMKNFHKDGILLLFCPSVSFFEERWEFFIQLVKGRSNFIELIEYNDYLFGIWMGVDKKYLPNLRWYYRKGFYSEFPKNLIPFLPEKEAKIVKRDELYQRSIEISLGLEEGELNNVELKSIPEPEEYTINLTNYIKKKDEKIME